MNQDLIIPVTEPNNITHLYRKYINEMYAYGIGLGFEKNRCMDAIHDVFCKLFINENQIFEIENIKFYLFRSLKNRLIDIDKQEKKIKHEDINQYNFTIEVSIIDTIIDKEEKKNLEEKVNDLLNSLTSTQREAIYLRYMQEMEYEEIARLLDINPESARKLVYRGIDKLRKKTNINICFILFLPISGINL